MSMKKNIINYIWSIALLILAIGLIWGVTKLSTPHILESDLIQQCKNLDGNYNTYQRSNGTLRVYCDAKEKTFFDETYN